MVRAQTKFVCRSCGGESLKWVGRCPDCGEWASMVEEPAAPKTLSGSVSSVGFAEPASINSIAADGASRVSSGIEEFDRVLGGGVVAGSLVLVGGDPGIGKSTLLIQAANNLSRTDGRVLYISGEESAEQIKLRSNRLGIASSELYVVAETHIEAVAHYVETLAPRYVFVDSIQTVFDSALSSAPGSVSQVRGCAAELARIAKTGGIPVFIVGHVTKEGSLAGPRVLEHMVDTVLYFEGDRHQNYRILRAVKNRFGSTDEIGVFEMRDDGLKEVSNPSEVLLSERSSSGAGSAVAATMEGTRPLLVEIQALVAPTYFPSPRRMCSGVDYNRTLMILAVLEKRVGLSVGSKDVYVNAAGGVRLNEPAADLAIALAVASSLLDRAIDGGTVAMGEIGLAGEVRSVSQTEKRLREAQRLGFKRAVTAGRATRNVAKALEVELLGVETVRSAIEACFPGVFGPG